MKTSLKFAIFGELLVCLMLLGCGTLKLDPAGVYKGDKVLYTADRAITSTYDTLHGFVNWQYRNRSELSKWPEVRIIANDIRANAEQWLSTVEALRDAYKVNPTDTNKTLLQLSLDELQATIVQAQGYLKQHSNLK